MIYEVIWHDAGDDRSGTSFNVEANSPREAFEAAIKKIRNYDIERFVLTDIECLVDEDGKHHHPDVFLK